MPWVYILRCRNGSYYTGSTDNLEKRLVEHKSGTFGGYTSHLLPVELVYQQETKSGDEAFTLEHQIKGWSRAKKEALIEGKWDLLPVLARCRARDRRE